MKLRDYTGLSEHEYDYGYGYGDLEVAAHAGREVRIETPKDHMLLLQYDGSEYRAAWRLDPYEDYYYTGYQDSPQSALIAVFTHIFECHPKVYWGIRGGHQQRLPLPLRTGLGEFVPKESGIEIDVWERALGGSRYLKLWRNDLGCRLSLHNAPKEFFDVMRTLMNLEHVSEPVLNVFGDDLESVERRFGTWLWSLSRAGEQASKVSREIVNDSRVEIPPWHNRLDDGFVK